MPRPLRSRLDAFTSEWGTPRAVPPPPRLVTISDEEEAEHAAWYAALTPDQRDAYDTHGHRAIAWPTR